MIKIRSFNFTIPKTYHFIMKSTLTILFIAAVTLFACNNKNQSPAEKEKAIQDSIKYSKAAEAKIDSLTKKLAGQFDEVLPEAIVTSLQIVKVKTEEPNSAGGVDCNIVCKNTSDKTVKYIRFSVAPFNAVNDMVASEIGNKTYVKLELTGPIKPGETSGRDTLWETVWYNSTISHMQITGIEIEYMDGTIYSTNRADIIQQISSK
jgi:hypothetical protein